jgi:outer membrane protein assembly factor BamB
MWRKRLAWALVGAVVLALVGGVAVVLQTRPTAPPGLDAALERVVREPPRRAPAPAPSTPRADEGERPCWRQFGGDAMRSLSRPALHLGLPTKTIWARGLGGYIEYPPTYCDGALYVNTFNGTTYAIEADTGRVLWKRRGAAKPSSPAIAGALLIVSANDGSVTAYERRSGRRSWRLHVGSRVESSPLVVEDDVFFGAADGRLFAAASGSGRVKWAFDTGGEINSSPSAFGNRVCITNYAGLIVCLRRSDGKEEWSTRVRRDYLRNDSFYSSASTDGERLYAISRSGKVVALSAATGRVLWTQRQHGYGYSTPAVSGGRVYVGGFDGALHAYDARTGRPVWQRHVGGRILGAPVVLGPLVFFATLEERAYAVRSSDGSLAWQIGIGKYSPAIATEDRYYMALNGILVAYRGSDGD